MKRMILDLDLTRCSACGACAVACMDQNDIDVENGILPFRTVFSSAKNQEFVYMSLSCMHCTNAPCIMGCPTGCLKKDPATHLTIFDHTNCIGCHSCSMACPFGAPSFGADGKMIKCDGCLTRMQNGYLPACVATCPTGALKVIEIDDAVEERRANSLHALAETIMKR